METSGADRGAYACRRPSRLAAARVGASTMKPVDFDFTPDRKPFVAAQSTTNANALVVVGWVDVVRPLLRGKEYGLGPDDGHSCREPPWRTA